MGRGGRVRGQRQIVCSIVWTRAWRILSRSYYKSTIGPSNLSRKRYVQINLTIVTIAVMTTYGSQAARSAPQQVLAAQLPDIRSIAADLVVPELTQESGPGRRSKRLLREEPNPRVYHTVYLPPEWTADVQWPMIVELTGNATKRDQYGDECSGRPEDACLGYGLTGGKRFIWISLPFLNATGDDLALTWWGDRPDYAPTATLDYMQRAIEDACHRFRADPRKVVLAGFSRGAIACNYLGLHDDKIAARWKALIAFSHYDGVREWPFPNSDAESASVRLKRLGNRPQLICGEKEQAEVTERYLKPLMGTSQITFVSTGFRNHSDRWVLRPSPARARLRAWLQQAID